MGRYDAETKAVRLSAAEAKTGWARIVHLEGLPELAAVIKRLFTDRRPGCALIFHRAGEPSTASHRAVVRHARARSKLSTKIRARLSATEARATTLRRFPPSVI